MRNGVAGIADVIGHDPDQTYEKAAEHGGSEPLWALLGQWGSVGNLIWDVNRILFATT